MALRKVLYADNPKLRQKAKKVKVFGPQLRQLANDMLETMRAENGVGLAGPQIGVLQRIFVAEIPEDEDDPNSGKSFVMVNPEIVKRSEEMEEGQEGCLSIPGWYGLVNRHRSIEIKARTVTGKPIKMKVSGFLARVFQHENDHLDGVLFVDHITEPEKLWRIQPEDNDTYVFEDVGALAV